MTILEILALFRLAASIADQIRDAASSDEAKRLAGELQGIWSKIREATGREDLPSAEALAVAVGRNMTTWEREPSPPESPIVQPEPAATQPHGTHFRKPIESDDILRGPAYGYSVGDLVLSGTAEASNLWTVVRADGTPTQGWRFQKDHAISG